MVKKLLELRQTRSIHICSYLKPVSDLEHANICFRFRPFDSIRAGLDTTLRLWSRRSRNSDLASRNTSHAAVDANMRAIL